MSPSDCTCQFTVASCRSVSAATSSKVAPPAKRSSTCSAISAIWLTARSKATSSFNCARTASKLCTFPSKIALTRNKAGPKSVCAGPITPGSCNENTTGPASPSSSSVISPRSTSCSVKPRFSTTSSKVVACSVIASMAFSAISCEGKITRSTNRLGN